MSDTGLPLNDRQRDGALSAGSTAVPAVQRRMRLVKKGRKANDRDVDRFFSFSDAVFAVALTLLLLDIALPNVLQTSSTFNVVIHPTPTVGTHPTPTVSGSGYEVTVNVGAFESKQYVIDRIGNYAVSFAIIALFWILHNLLFRSLDKIYRRVSLANLLLLFLVTLIPVTARFYSDHPMNNTDNAGLNLIYGFNVNAVLAAFIVTLLCTQELRPALNGRKVPESDLIFNGLRNVSGLFLILACILVFPSLFVDNSLLTTIGVFIPPSFTTIGLVITCKFHRRIQHFSR